MDIANIDITYLVIVLGTILVSMTLHEAMHGFVAYWLGDDTARLEGRLTLNPVKHIDPFLTILLPIFLAIAGAPIFGGAKPVPFNPNRVRHGEWGAALVALAGPLTNLILGFIFFGIFVAGTFLGIPLGHVFYTIFGVATAVNLGFFVFNMLPVPPLDGSRVIYALAPDGVRRVMELIERYGLIAIFAIVMLFSPYIGVIMREGIDGILALFRAIYGVS